MAVESVRIALQERGAGALTDLIDDLFCSGVNFSDVLPIHYLALDAETSSSRDHVTGKRFGVVRIFVVEVVFANVDHRKLPKSCHVHDFVEQALPHRSITKEANGNLVRLQSLRRKRGSRCN